MGKLAKNLLKTSAALIAIVLLSSPAAAQSWTYLGLGGHVVLSLKSHGSVLYAGTDQGFYTKARAGTDTTWTFLSLPDSEIDDFEIVNDTTFVATRYIRSVDESMLIRSTDSGLTWTTVYSPGAWFSDIEMRPDLPDTLYACSSTSGIFKSRNGGQTWTPCSYPLGHVTQKVKISPFDSQHLLAGGENYYFQSRLYESRNGGASWTNVTTLGSPGGDNSIYGIDFDPTDENRIDLGMEDWTGLSTNGGSSWTFQMFPSSGFWYVMDVVVDPLEPTRVFYMPWNVFGNVSPLHMAVSDNRGESWTVLDYDPGYGYGEAYDVELVLEDGSRSVYFGGRGVYRVAPFGVSGVGESNPPGRTLSLSPTYERNGRMVIPYTVSQSGTAVTLAIYDLSGRQVFRFPEVRRDPGLYEVEWSGSDRFGRPVSRGIYFARLSTPGITVGGRIVWTGRGR